MVLARFSYAWALASLVGNFLVLFGFGDIYFRHDTDLLFWILVPVLPLLVLYVCQLLSQLMFHGARAVWIADGNLIFLHYGWPRFSFFRSIPLDDIDRFSLERIDTGSFVTWLKGIGVHQRAGGYFQIPSYLLAESRDAILARLNEALAAHR